LASENAAHRFAVEWGRGARAAQGVFVARRDTSSRLNCLAGGCLFPGEHRLSSITGLDDQSTGRVAIGLRASDGLAINLAGRESSNGALPAESRFEGLEESSEFFRGGSLGYSPRADAVETFDGVELAVDEWKVAPFVVERLQSTYFSDSTRFPPGSLAYDHALVMRDIPHSWNPKPPLILHELPTS
jgi:hypothetical protein